MALSREALGWRAATAARSYTPHPTPCTLHPAPCNLHPASCTLHPAPCTLRPAPCTLHPAPCALHPALCTRVRTVWHLAAERPSGGAGGESSAVLCACCRHQSGQKPDLMVKFRVLRVQGSGFRALQGVNALRLCQPKRVADEDPHHPQQSQPAPPSTITTQRTFGNTYRFSPSPFQKRYRPESLTVLCVPRPKSGLDCLMCAKAGIWP